MADNPNLWILNGPNLNLLGDREPDQYGHETLDTIKDRCVAEAKIFDISIDFRQTNHEGELVAWIQESKKEAAGLIINAGAYTHTSVAVLDALKLLTIPIIEVHLSNIFSREEFRHHSYVSSVASGLICGFGGDGYLLSIRAISNRITN
ncbi:MAG: type II 3-dehydroquinate dehydratase [Alphaproteobacteria bacterium]|nr:type II 3-dehydroquinate dehydratase [Alphaproteobacteria bacterium]PPR13205.1 MAG: 3-dehydroquinate dehydratase [Alphaproteobacteria bacterium MarineAlpha12_Bin1]